MSPTTDRPGTALVHPVLATADLTAAIGYYRDVLGLVPGAVTEHDELRLARLSGLSRPSAEAVVLTAPGGGEVELVRFHRPSCRPASAQCWPDPGIRSVTFEVDDLPATLGRVREAGHQVLGDVVRFPQADHELDVVYVSAPDGVLLTLVERLPAGGGTG